MVLAVFGLMGPIAGALVHNIGSVIVIVMAALLLRYDCWGNDTTRSTGTFVPEAAA
jgi:cation transport ATPase